MKEDTKEEKQEALIIIASTIDRCTKAQQRFLEGSSQHSLLKNRLVALRIAKELIEEGKCDEDKEQVQKALAPIVSILHKCEKAQSKYDMDHKQYKRYIGLIQAMHLAKAYIEKELHS